MLHIEGDDIVELRIEHGKVNAMDVDLLDRITDALREIAADRPRALILTGTGKVFSAGADLRRVLDGDASYIEAGVAALGRCFTTLFAFPHPVVAAVNGHAIAGGAVLVCACDHRIMGGGGVIGLSELRVGVPFPTAALEVVRFAVRPRDLVQLVLFGDLYTPEQARDRGLVDEVVESAGLLDRAREVAERLGSIPAATFAHTKMSLRGPTLDRIEQVAAARDAEVARIWSSPEARASIEAFMASLP